MFDTEVYLVLREENLGRKAGKAEARGAEEKGAWCLRTYVSYPHSSFKYPLPYSYMVSINVDRFVRIKRMNYKIHAAKMFYTLGVTTRSGLPYWPDRCRPQPAERRSDITCIIRHAAPRHFQKCKNITAECLWLAYVLAVASFSAPHPEGLLILMDICMLWMTGKCSLIGEGVCGIFTLITVYIRLFHHISNMHSVKQHWTTHHLSAGPSFLWKPYLEGL